MTLPDAWRGLVDDAALFPPGDAAMADAVAAWQGREEEWYAPLVGSFVVKDVDLGALARLAKLPVSIVATTGAGGIGPALALADRLGLPVRGIEVALRDVDDLPGNARRVVAALDAARGDSALASECPVFVELPAEPPSTGWLAAADEVAAAELRLKFRTGGLSPDTFPTADTLARWIDAALDRETPFKCTAGLHNAARHRDPQTGFEHHGFLNILGATAAAFDGAAATDVVPLLENPPETDVDVARARRWFTSFGSCSVTEPLDDLIALGVLEEPHDLG